MARQLTGAALQFSNVLSKWKSAYRRIHVVFVAFEGRNSAWNLAYARLVFQPHPFPQEPLDLIVQTGHLHAGRFLVDLASPAADPFITDAFDGLLRCGPAAYAISNNPEEQLSSHYFSQSPPSIRNGNVRTPYLTLSSHSSSNMESELNSEELDAELRTRPDPFDGLEDLFQAIGISGDFQLRNHRHIALGLYTPTDVVLARSQIASGSAHVVIEAAPNLNRNLLSVGFRQPVENLDPKRFSISGTDLAWTDKGNWSEAHTSLPVGNAKVLQCFVSYGGEHVSRWWITDPTKQLNYRTSIQRTFDPEDKKLRHLLFPPKTEARDIEKGVALLLGLHGFVVLQFGEKEQFQEGPDLFVATPAHKILVIECTTELNEPIKKVTKLKDRTIKIRERLVHDSFGHLEIVPVLVVGKTRDELKRHRDLFVSEEVAIVANENLEELVQRLVLPSDPEGLFEEVKKLIPRSDPFDSILR